MVSPPSPPSSAPFLLLFQSTVVDDYSELDALTPRQIKALRRETAQRRAAKTLATVFLPRDAEECGGPPPFSSQTLAEIGNQLQKHALVEVRGVAVHDKRLVKTVAERLAFEVALENSSNSDDNKPVFVVDIRGHACVLFRPNNDDDGDSSNNSLPPLRTTRKANRWRKRPRKPRDNAGQIVR